MRPRRGKSNCCVRHSGRGSEQGRRWETPGQREAGENHAAEEGAEAGGGGEADASACRSRGGREATGQVEQGGDKVEQVEQKQPDIAAGVEKLKHLMEVFAEKLADRKVRPRDHDAERCLSGARGLTRAVPKAQQRPRLQPPSLTTSG